MLVLALSVGVPGLVLSSFAFRSVRSEALVEQAQFQERCESVAGLLFDEADGRFARLESDLGTVIAEAGELWGTDPGLAAKVTAEQVEGVRGVLVLDADGDLLYPLDAMRSHGAESDRPGVGDDLRSVMGRRFQEAEDVELLQRDHERAAHLYLGAIPAIPGYRGQLIARSARARCLFQAGHANDALELYRGLADEASGYRDLNGFPLDLLAAYQVVLCQLASGDQQGAVRSLLDLTSRLSEQPWSYGGYAESVISGKLLEHLEGPDIDAMIPASLRADLPSLKRELQQRRRQQSQESMILAFFGDMVGSRARTGPAVGSFAYSRTLRGGHTILLARTAWNGAGGTREIVMHLDEATLLEGFHQRLDGIQQANPELSILLGEVGMGPSPLAAPAEGAVYQLEPWVPGRTVVVARGDPTQVSSLLSRTRRLRLLTIGVFSLFILVGLGISYRAVRREFEIARLRTDFVSNVSHELRTPLATIRIMAEMLTMGAVPPGEKQQEYHGTILSETERLTRLIENVLDFARIEQGRKKYSFEIGDIIPVISEVQRVTQDYLASHDFSLEVQAQSELPPVKHDHDALVQALINLVSNAVQYSAVEDPERRTITISAYRQRDTVVLSVKDRGQGIEATDRSRVFGKFQRGGDHLTREVRGTGLGLSIVQHIVEAHGGEVTLASEEGQGSTFYLLLPAAEIRTY